MGGRARSAARSPSRPRAHFIHAPDTACGLVASRVQVTDFSLELRQFCASINLQLEAESADDLALTSLRGRPRTCHLMWVAYGMFDAALILRRLLFCFFKGAKQLIKKPDCRWLRSTISAIDDANRRRVKRRRRRQQQQVAPVSGRDNGPISCAHTAREIHQMETIE